MGRRKFLASKFRALYKEPRDKESMQRRKRKRSLQCKTYFPWRAWGLSNDFYMTFYIWHMILRRRKTISESPGLNSLILVAERCARMNSSLETCMGHTAGKSWAIVSGNGLEGSPGCKTNRRDKSSGSCVSELFLTIASCQSDINEQSRKIMWKRLGDSKSVWTPGKRQDGTVKGDYNMKIWMQHRRHLWCLGH